MSKTSIAEAAVVSCGLEVVGASRDATLTLGHCPNYRRDSVVSCSVPTGPSGQTGGVVPVFKMGTRENYREITLLCPPDKVLERRVRPAVEPRIDKEQNWVFVPVVEH